MESDLHVVTGAFGFSGKYIARRLLDAGFRVRTLTNSPNRENPFGEKVEVSPYHFGEPEKLEESLRGASVLYNNYWVRFNAREFRFSRAVKNSAALFEAAGRAGVGRIVQISITHPSEDSPLEYFRGKAQVEKALAESGIPHSILRPAVLFGKEDILINNIAWMLRRFPLFAVFGTGEYRLQPIYVDDLAELAVAEGAATGNRVIDAVGPETFTYLELVRHLGRIIGHERPVLYVPDSIGYCAGSLVGRLLGDVTITRDEIRGLKAGLLYTGAPPVGKTALTEWAEANAAALGVRYASELARRKNREAAYEKL